MTDIGEIVLDDNFLECPVCLEIFDDTCKMLPCQHTFHKRCLQKIYDVEERLECPQCRKLVSEDIELLPRNYFLLSVLERAKPKPSVSDQESLQLQFVIERSKSEAEVKAREEFLLSQKEKLEYELMLLKSEKKDCVADAESKSQNSSTSSVCGYTYEGGEENCCSISSESSPHKGAVAALLVKEFGSIQIFDTSPESPEEYKSPDTCAAITSIEQQVTDGFKTLNMFDVHSSLALKLLEIVRAVDGGKNFQGIELMHLIDYDDLIESYLSILADQLKENSYSTSSQPPSEGRTIGDGATVSCDLTACANVSSPSSDAKLDVFMNPVLISPPKNASSNVELYDDISNKGDTTCIRPVLPEINPMLSNDYQSYTFDDDDRNLNYAMELSRQLMAANESEDLMEEVLLKSKITCTIDQQKQIFLSIREKVELQIALLMSKI